MTTIVFAGPSLPVSEREAVDGVCWRPPARHGDVYRAARERPAAIGLIDAVFETVLTVWHKEILWALASGVPVWGAASMGALRAVELGRFGMRGVGVVFELYRDGVLRDDGDVAVLHAPEELGFRPLTEALVDARATLLAAAEQGLLLREQADALIREASGIFFKDRTWDAILARAAPDVAQRLRPWLPTGRIEQKRRDARAMLAAMRERPAAPPEAAEAWTFAATGIWQRARRRMEAEHMPGLDPIKSGGDGG